MRQSPQGSFTSMALQVALAGAKEAGAQTRLIDLREYHLIFCDGKEDESGYPQMSSRCGRMSGRPRGSFSPPRNTTAATAVS